MKAMVRLLPRLCLVVVLALVCLSTLAAQSTDREKLELKVRRLEKKLQQLTRTRGKNHPDVLGLRAEVARGYLDLGRSREANARYVSLVSAYARQVSTGDRRLAEARVGVADCMLQRGKPKKARQILKVALAAYGEAHGEKDAYTQWLQHRLASCLHLLGEYLEAYAQFRELYGIAAEEHGETHPSALRAGIAVGACAIELGRYEEARTYLEKSLEKLDPLDSANRAYLDSARNNLAVLYMKVGENARARSLLEQGLAEAPKPGQEGAADYQLERENLVTVLEALGEYEEAVRWLDEVVQVYAHLARDNPRNREWRKKRDSANKHRERLAEKSKG